MGFYFKFQCFCVKTTTHGCNGAVSLSFQIISRFSKWIAMFPRIQLVASYNCTCVPVILYGWHCMYDVRKLHNYIQNNIDLST